MKKTEGEHGAEWQWMRDCRAVLIGGTVAFGVSLLLLLLCALGIEGGRLSASGDRITVLAGIGGSFVGGLTGLRIRETGGFRLIVGLCTGVVQFLLQLTAGLLFFDAMQMEQGSLGLLFASLCGGGAAGLLGAGWLGKKRTYGRRAVARGGKRSNSDIKSNSRGK